MESPDRLQKLFKAALIVVIVCLSAWFLKAAATFLIPITFAALLAMLLLPICQWLQEKGVNKAIATIASILVLVGAFALIIFFFSYQITDIAQNTDQLEDQLRSRYRELQEYISSSLGISPEKQQQMLKQQQSSISGKLSGIVQGFIAGLGGLLTNIVLVLVYIFLFIYFRHYIKRFILQVVEKDQIDNARDTMKKAQKVTQKYLTGMALMIISLWIMYGIGFSIAGVKSPVFFAVLCGTLELIPFVGNLLGNAITVLVSVMQGGDMNVVLGILITYGAVQFFQSYILEPLVVGSEVNLNPLFTIIALIGAEVIWGLPGMVLAIPVMGVIKIICDHVEPLKPFGQLIGEDKKEDNALKKKVKQLFRKGKSRVSG